MKRIADTLYKFGRRVGKAFGLVGECVSKVQSLLAALHLIRKRNDPTFRVVPPIFIYKNGF